MIVALVASPLWPVHNSSMKTGGNEFPMNRQRLEQRKANFAEDLFSNFQEFAFHAVSILEGGCGRRLGAA